jgi:hypothetical protein
MVKKKKATKKGRTRRLTKLQQFIISLSKDTEKARAFRDDPDAMIDEEGFNDSSRKVLKSHSLEDLRKFGHELSGDELGGDELGGDELGGDELGGHGGGGGHGRPRHKPAKKKKI